MPTKSPPALLLTAGLLAAMPALGQKAHVHGEGRLEASIERDRLELRLELPLDVAVGFERAPRDEKERAALAAAEKALKDAPALWQPTAAANCSPQQAEVLMPRLDGSGHKDIEARYVFRCTHVSALKAIDTTVFRQFGRLYRLEALRAGPAGQGRQRLTPKNPALGW